MNINLKSQRQTDRSIHHLLIQPNPLIKLSFFPFLLTRHTHLLCNCKHTYASSTVPYVCSQKVWLPSHVSNRSIKRREGPTQPNKDSPQPTNLSRASSYLFLSSTSADSDRNHLNYTKYVRFPGDQPYFATTPICNK